MEEWPFQTMYSASRIWKAPCQELMGSRTVHGQRRYTRACPRSWTNPLQTHLSIRELVAVVDAQCCTRSTTIHNIAYPVPHARASERRVVRLPPGRTYLLEFNGDLSKNLIVSPACNSGSQTLRDRDWHTQCREPLRTHGL